ncbi:MAG: avidin/streptavidin family protein [Cyanobacteria bacterium P01_G01_bin.54]
MMNIKSIVTLCLTFLITAILGVVNPSPAYAFEAQLANSTTHWINQGGSKMTLVLANCGVSQPIVCQASGTYVNNEPGYKCQGSPYPLTGVYYINTQTISWSVAWSNGHDDCQSVTGWTGYLGSNSSGQLQFLTDWNLAYATSGGGRTIQQGKDTFTKVPHPISSQSLLKDSQSE